MKKILSATILAAILVGQANAALAMFVRQYMGRSVTGQTIVVCVYRYNNSEFEKYLPMGNFCPPSVQVQ